MFSAGASRLFCVTVYYIVLNSYADLLLYLYCKENFNKTIKIKKSEHVREAVIFAVPVRNVLSWFLCAVTVIMAIGDFTF